ncbi:hypothetical protein HZC32_02240 [Candidatus Woesearchaeota archaeon]|nr:hypothetical protein [Candidatus Woesearchaeota archaeon]
MKKKLALVGIVLLLALVCSGSAVSDKPYHLKLLAVHDSPDGKYMGSDADLYLELRPGSGRVFLNYDETVAITGTINSGATIGPVSGLKEKLDVASKATLKTVLIPKGTAVQRFVELQPPNATGVITDKIIDKNPLNFTLNLINYAKQNLSLEVVEVMDLDEALFKFTGQRFSREIGYMSGDSEYQKIMQGLQQLLCSRTEKLKSQLAQTPPMTNNSTVMGEVAKKEALAKEAVKQKDYYSAASFCFGNNVVLKNQFYRQNRATISTLNTLFSSLDRKIREVDGQLKEQKISTISDLQTLMVVKERLNDVSQQVKKYSEGKNTSSLEELYSLLAYAEERYFSALSWMQFFSMDGKKFVMDMQQLKDSCTRKISEAEERYQYASIYVGEVYVTGIKEKIDQAHDALKQVLDGSGSS